MAYENPKPKDQWTHEDWVQHYRQVRERNPHLQAKEPSNGPGLSIKQFVDLIQEPLSPELAKVLPKLKI